MKNLAKDLILLSFVMIVIGLGLNYKEEIIALYRDASGYLSSDAVVEKNAYYREYDFEYLQNVTDFEPNNFQDIINIFYTVINAGEMSFTFYCPNEYEGCVDDVKKLVDDEETLSNINNFVHPFNSFKNIEILCGTLGSVTINVEKAYEYEDTLTIGTKVDSIYSSVVNEAEPDEVNIRKIHDYLINSAKYDTPRSEQGDETYRSDNAYGVLFEGWGVCSGYTDAMQLFLEKMGIKNYRVSSENHVWNAVYLNGKWHHLDLTWDDPVVSDGSDYLDDSYFLISTEKLLDLEKTEHNFDQEVYLELKSNS